MKKYKIKYWLDGNKYSTTIYATDSVEARLYMYLYIHCDDIISIEEVKENV